MVATYCGFHGNITMLCVTVCMEALELGEGSDILIFHQVAVTQKSVWL